MTAITRQGGNAMSKRWWKLADGTEVRTVEDLGFQGGRYAKAVETCDGKGLVVVSDTRIVWSVCVPTVAFRPRNFPATSNEPLIERKEP